MSNDPPPCLPITGDTSVSSVVVYSPRTSTDDEDDFIYPVSSTSSLRGLYVRSRPTSMEIPAGNLGFDFGGFHQASFNRIVQQGHEPTEYPLVHGDCSLSSSTLSANMLTPATSEDASVYIDEEYIQNGATKRSEETRARLKALNEGHARARKYYRESIPLSVTTTGNKNTIMSPGLVLQFNKKGNRGTTTAATARQDIEEGNNVASALEMMEVQAQAGCQKKSSIPLVYRTVTQKVYGVFHRKAHSTPESIQFDSEFSDNSTNNDGTTTYSTVIQELKPAEEPIKYSSISLRTRKRRLTIGNQQEPPRSKNIFSQRTFPSHRNKNAVPPDASNTAVLASTSSLATGNHVGDLRRSISFSGFMESAELDSELDEATAEATHVATRALVMARWGNV